MKRSECTDPSDWRWISGFEDDRYVRAVIVRTWEDGVVDTYWWDYRISDDWSADEITQEITKVETTGYKEVPKIEIKSLSLKANTRDELRTNTPHLQ